MVQRTSNHKKSPTPTTVEEDVTVEEVDETTAAAVFDDTRDPDAAIEAATTGEQEDTSEIPEWVGLPPDFQFPPGKKVGFMRFRADWTETPGKGGRVVVMWTLDVQEEQFAYARARGDNMRAIAELTKQSIRLIDGRAVDFTGTKKNAANVNQFWKEIGGACRQLIQNYYLKTHTLTREQLQDFFSDCFVSRSAVGG